MLKIHTLEDEIFRTYGQVLTGFDTAGLLREAAKIPLPEEGSAYQTSTPAFEALPIAREIRDRCFGALPTQVGYCWGRNFRMNAMEYHASPEINVAVTSFILILGHRWDLRDGKVDSSAFRAFFVPKGTVLEVFATTLHFCPCQTAAAGFGCVVALPKGTNTPLEGPSPDPLLFKKSKWLLAHVDNEALIRKGASPAITGENYDVSYEE